MSTRSCPTCGTQYVATVRRCINCDIDLVDDAGPAAEDETPGASGRPEAGGSHLTYELAGWGNQLKVTLEGMLDRGDIARVWEAGALVVPAVHEESVDRLIATLDGDDVADVADDLPRVALEIEGLDADRQADLDAQLIASGLAYAWDEEGDLVILEDDEHAVLAIIDDVLDGDTGADDDDPLAGQAALSDLFVAVDRLVKKPSDPALASPIGEVVARLEDLAVPYGFSAAAWEGLVAEGRELARLVDPGGTLDLNEGHDVPEAADGPAEPDHDGAPGDADDVGLDDDGLKESAEQDLADQVALKARALRDQLADLV